MMVIGFIKTPEYIVEGISNLFSDHARLSRDNAAGLIACDIKENNIWPVWSETLLEKQLNGDEPVKFEPDPLREGFNAELIVDESVLRGRIIDSLKGVNTGGRVNKKSSPDMIEGMLRIQHNIRFVKAKFVKVPL